MKNFKLYMTALFVVGFAGLAWADGYDLAYKDTKTFPVTTTAPATGDQKLIWVAADNKWELFTATSEKLTGTFNGTVGATTPAAGTFTTLTASGVAALNGANTSTGSLTYTRAPGADSATTNNTSKVALTAPVDTTGTNTHQAYDVALTVSNATAGTNTVNGYRFENYTGDAQVNVNALLIGTSDGLGTANAITVGSGWDLGLTTASKVLNTYAAGADSGTTNKSSAYTFTYPVDTTGTNTHTLLDMALTAANATGGTNTVNGFNFANYTGDAQVNVNAINIGTSDGLGVANAITVGSGWDLGLTSASKILQTYAAGADSGTTNKSMAFTFTYPVDTTGTNTHTLIDMALTAANATGGTNTVNGLNFANYTGDAQVNVNAINIGTSDALGTAVALKIGSGWDTGIQTDSNLVVNSTNGTAISAIRFVSDTVASGQTAKTATLTGVTTASKCVATGNEIPSNAAYIKSAAPGTDQVVVTVNTDPGASNLDFTVICMN